MPGHQRKFDHDLARDMYADGVKISELARFFGVSDRSIRYVVLNDRPPRQPLEVLRKLKADWWESIGPEGRRAYYDRRQVARDRRKLERWKDVPVPSSNTHRQECELPGVHRAHLWAPAGQSKGWWCSGMGENAEKPPAGSGPLKEPLSPPGASPCPDETPSE